MLEKLKARFYTRVKYCNLQPLGLQFLHCFGHTLLYQYLAYSN